MKKILIVDDIINNCILLKSMLENFGYDSQMAYNGQEALLLLKKNKYYIVFMDIEMPVMNGIEATKLLRDTLTNGNQNIPVIATTAFKNSDQINDDLYGFTDFILKPFQLEKIKSILEKYV